MRTHELTFEKAVEPDMPTNRPGSRRFIASADACHSVFLWWLTAESSQAGKLSQVPSPYPGIPL